MQRRSCRSSQYVVRLNPFGENSRIVDLWQLRSLLQIGPFVPDPKGYLSRVVEPGQNVPRAKKYLRPAGLEPKTY